MVYLACLAARLFSILAAKSLSDLSLAASPVKVVPSENPTVPGWA